MSADLVESMVAIRGRQIVVADATDTDLFPIWLKAGTIEGANPHAWINADLKNIEGCIIEVISGSGLLYRHDGSHADRGPHVRNLTAQIAAYSSETDAYPASTAGGYQKLALGQSTIIPHAFNVQRLRAAGDGGASTISVIPLQTFQPAF